MSLFETKMHQDFEHIEYRPHHLKERVHDFVTMPAKAKAFLFLGTIIFAGIVTGLVLLQQPASWHVYYSSIQGGDMKADSEIRFNFSRPMSRNVQINIDPPMPGNWYFEDRLSRLHLSREFRFVPLQTWKPGTTYTIIFTGMHAIFDLGTPSQEVSYRFTVQPFPHAQEFIPGESEHLSADSYFHFMLDQPNSGLATFDVQLDPPVELIEGTTQVKDEYWFKPKEPLAQGTRYTATLTMTPTRHFLDTGEVSYEGEPQTILQRSYKTREAPGVDSFSPTGDSVARDTEVRVAFSSKPKGESLPTLAFEPALSGDWNLDGSTAIFTPQDPLSYDTKYTLTIPKGFSTENGGYFESDVTYSFHTIGPVKVVATSPGPGATGVAVDRQIRIDFDQAVDHTSAESSFRITPGLSGSFSWDGATLIYTPAANMPLDTTYSITLAKGIKSQAGQPSVEDYTWSFATQPTIVRLNVPYDHQDYALSCEVAALKMALAYKGVGVSEDQLMNIVGYDPTPHSGDVWGNPYKAFVGSITGRQSTTGYGVYWDPIAKAANVYRSGQAFTNGTVQQLTAAVNSGNPVVVWGNVGSGTRVDWKTPEGVTIYAINGEHARVVKGYVGPADNPSKIIVNDPLYGEIVYNTSSFKSNWATLFKAGVIVQ